MLVVEIRRPGVGQCAGSSAFWVRGAAAPRLVEALKRLQYRGYDSAGVATLENGRLRRSAREGFAPQSRSQASGTSQLDGPIGIGHTRWATHGKPTENNAHPHASERLAVVHNGIIENFRELREELAAKGYRFQTETDTEVAAFLVTDEIDQGKSPADAVYAALSRMRGAFALVYLFEGEDDLLIGTPGRARRSPVGPPQGESAGRCFWARMRWRSRPSPTTIAYLEEGDWVIATQDLREIPRARDNNVVTRRFVKEFGPGGFLACRKNNYRHFMAPEILRTAGGPRPHHRRITSTWAH